MENNNKKSFLAMNAGTTMDKNGNSIPYAFLVEGIVVGIGNFVEAETGRPAILNLNVLVGRNPWIMLGKDAEAEQANNPDVNADKPFVRIAVYGDAAARLKNIQKNSKVVFCGRPVKNAYKKKESGADAASVNVNVDEIYVAQNKNASADVPRRQVTSIINRYEREGEVRTQSLGMLACTVINDMEVRTTASGQDVASVRVRLALPALEAAARINREYKKETDYGTYMDATLSVWGPRANKMDKILRRGAELAVVASVRTNTGNNGLTYVTLNARDLSVLKWGDAAPDSAPAEADNPSSPAPAATEYNGSEPESGFVTMDEDEEMDLPF